MSSSGGWNHALSNIMVMGQREPPYYIMASCEINSLLQLHHKQLFLHIKYFMDNEGRNDDLFYSSHALRNEISGNITNELNNSLFEFYESYVYSCHMSIEYEYPQKGLLYYLFGLSFGA